jgi:PAS domain S-box-containing protein
MKSELLAQGKQDPRPPGTAWHGAALHKSECLVSLILLAVILAIGGTGWGYFKRQQATFLQAAETELSAIADLKVSQICQWREERLADANLLLETELMQATAREFLEDAANSEARTRLLDWMAVFQRHNRIKRIVLLDSHLQARLAIPANEGWAGPQAAQFAAVALQTNRVLISDLHAGRVSGRVNMEFLVPLVSPSPQASRSLVARGVFLLEIDPNDFLFPSIQTWPTPSPTAETLLVRREGEEVVYLNELRHQTNTALRLRFALTNDPNLPAARAVLGQFGIVRSLDYRRQPVLAALRRVPDSPWFLVTKRDEAEINAPLRKEAWIIGQMVAALILAGTLGVFLVWRNRKYRLSLQEIEDRKRTEEALRQSAERFRSFTAAAFEGICLSEQGRILDCNDQFSALFGYERAENIGREILTLIAPESRPRVAEAIQTGREAVYEHQGLNKDGTVFEVEARAKIVLWEGRKVRVTAVRDITDRKRAQEELDRKNKELESVIYVSSHDLRSPLVNIQGFSHRLQMACNDIQRLLGAPDLPPQFQTAVAPILRDRVAPSLDFILVSVVRMDTLLAGLLRLSRLGRSALRMEMLDMQRLAEAALHALTFQLQQAGAHAELAALPPCFGDSTQVSQIFTNLLDNALKYREPGRPLRIQIRAEPRGAEMVYCVEDNGLGIAAEHQEKIWEVFQRLDPTGTVSGEGLGLAIVRRILDRHRGRAWVESEPGRGSCFFVALPATAAPLPT